MTNQTIGGLASLEGMLAHLEYHKQSPNLFSSEEDPLEKLESEYNPLKKILLNESSLEKEKDFYKNSIEKHPLEKEKDFHLSKKNLYENESLESKNYYNNKSFISGIIQTNSGINLSFTSLKSARATAEDVCEFVLPIVQYIRELKPDYIVANDRGARVVGLAVAQMYKRLHGRLPTVDGSLRFRRFSKSNTRGETERHVQPLVEEMLRKKERPVVLFLDDWVCSGKTRNIAEETFKKLSGGKVETKFAVFSGHGGNVSGTCSLNVDWADNPQLIGVDYKGTNAFAVRSEESREYRKRMIYGADRLVAKIVKGKFTKNPIHSGEQLSRAA